jgi:hypothetical protein
MLFACNPAKEEYRIWQCRPGQTGPLLTLRIEHHGAAPGWHVHGATAGGNAFLAVRHAVPAGGFAAIRPDGIWPREDRHPPFPAERMSADTIEQLCGLLAHPVEDITLRPVPFGLAVGLTERRLMGDCPAIYISQLGRETPVFRLEDDGVTIPALQASGALPAADYMLPHDILGAGTRGRLHFSPDMRTLFTPYFTADELAARMADFGQALGSFATILDAHQKAPADEQRLRSSRDAPATPSPARTEPRPNGNAWTRAVSYVTV